MFMTLTAYAARRGVSAKAVSKAVAAGRLSASVTRDQHGAPKISDPDLADREWSANTRARIDYVAPPDVAEAPPRERPPRVPAQGGAGAVSPELAEYYAHRSARESATARTASVQAELAELELAERRGQMIPIAAARLDVMEAYTIVKTKLLGVPRGVAQRLPNLAAEVILVVDEMIREALEDLASDGAGGG